MLVNSKRRDQVKSKGVSHDLIDCLALASQSRAHLSKCLQSHIEGINDVITNNTSFDLEQKSRLATNMGVIEKRLTSKLSHSEQSLRELLQIVRMRKASDAYTNHGSTGACLGFNKRVCQC